jgi:hypothetical protein
MATTGAVRVMVPFSLAVLSRRHSDSFSPVHRVALFLAY